MAEKKRSARAGAAGRIGKRAKRRENAFRSLSETVDKILEVAPKVDQSIIEELNAIKRFLRERAAPPRPRKDERGA